MLFLPLLCLGQMETNGTIKAELVTKFELNYLLQKPNNNKDLKPLIIFLHGSGEKGTDLEKLKIHGPLKYAKTHELDAYILAPQCPENKYWESEELYLLIQKVLAENKIDKSRIYLTGLSMGAWGSWNLAFAHPELFAALVPIAGFVDRVPMVENCKISTIPIRIFHGLQDDIVDANYSIAIFNKLRGCNKDIKLQLFDDANHDSWTRVYDNPAIYEWMLMQKK
jgi:predicted peptidase